MSEPVLVGDLKGVILKEREVSRRIDALGLEEDTKMALKEKLLPFVIEAEKWKAIADAIDITQEGDKDKMKQARETRVALKGIRVNLEKERKALKKESLARGQAIDLIAGTLRTLIEPIEDDLDLKERYDEIKLAERKQKLWEQRAQELAIYKLEQFPLDLREASEEDYQKLKEGLEVARLAQIEKDAELERLRLAEVARQAEITRKKELAAARSKEMLSKGFQHEGVDLGEMNDIDYALLLTTKQAEADEKKKLQQLRELGEQSVRSLVLTINRAALIEIEGIKTAIDFFESDPEREEKLADFYKEKAIYLRGILEEKNNQLLAAKEAARISDLKKEVDVIFQHAGGKIIASSLDIIEFPEKLKETPGHYSEIHTYYQERVSKLYDLYANTRRQLENTARLEKEKAALVVENVELQAQVPEIVVEKKVEAPAPKQEPAKKVGVVGKPATAAAIAKEVAQAPAPPPGPTPEQINADRLTLMTLAGIIAGIKMPEVQTDQAKNVLTGTGQLIEKIRVYLVEKSKALK